MEAFKPSALPSLNKMANRDCLKSCVRDTALIKEGCDVIFRVCCLCPPGAHLAEIRGASLADWPLQSSKKLLYHLKPMFVLAL